MTARPSSRPGEIEFSVADNGAGIAAADRERVFEMFARAPTADRSERSAGIGLAVCKRAVERHGGRIWVHEGPGGGADIRFTWPADDAAEARAA